MKLKIGIAGYGNLGKSLEKAALSDSDVQLCAIFSRRNIDNALARRFETSDCADLDVVLLALGSYNDIAENVKFFKNFHTVDSFDTHAKMQKYKNELTRLKPNKISICGVGWDPGVLSVVRGLFSVGNCRVSTFWGDGISQGHSNALRSIDGVLDAVEITQPLENAVNASLNGEPLEENARHNRLCYVACAETDRDRIEKEIREMPNYFAGQQTEIVFCAPQEVREKKMTTSHSGRVIVTGDGYKADTELFVESNTDFTAKIMLEYAKAIPQMEKDGYRGGLDPFDVPLKYLADKSVI